MKMKIRFTVEKFYKIENFSKFELVYDQFYNIREIKKRKKFFQFQEKD